MLEEKAGYLKDFPINIRVTHIENYPLHYHYDPEFIYVLKGFVTLKCGSSIYKMQQGDIFVVNESEVHGIYHCSTDNVVLMIQINTKYYIKQFPNLNNSVYRTLSKDRSDENLLHLRSQLLHVAFNYLKRSPGYKMEDTELMVDIIQFMDKYFASFYFEGKTVMQKKFEKPELTERLGRIINYLYKHHSENITLKDLANEEFLSEYYISHLITTGTGLNFRELLAFARVEESEKLLLQSNEKISSIAKKSGFSTTEYYRKFFKKWYRCDPEEYRVLYSRHIKGFDLEKSREIEQSRALDLITELINFLSFESEEEIGVRFYYDELDIDVTGYSIGEFGKKVELGGEEKSKYIIYGGYFLSKVLGINPDQENNFYIEETGNYIWDTLATIPHLQHIFMDDSIDVVRENNYSDSGKQNTLIAGERGIYISQEIAKPSFYAYRMFESMKGDVLAKVRNCLVTRGTGERAGQYSILACNTSESIEVLFEKGGSINQVQKTIKAFGDSCTYKITLKKLESGTYDVFRTSQNHDETMFSIAVLDNNKRKRLSDEDIMLIDEATVPKTTVDHQYIDGELQIDINLKNLSFTYIRIVKR